MRELHPFRPSSVLWVAGLWEGCAKVGGWRSHAVGMLGLYQQRWVILGGVSGRWMG